MELLISTYLQRCKSNHRRAAGLHIPNRFAPAVQQTEKLLSSRVRREEMRDSVLANPHTSPRTKTGFLPVGTDQMSSHVPQFQVRASAAAPTFPGDKVGRN